VNKEYKNISCLVPCCLTSGCALTTNTSGCSRRFVGEQLFDWRYTDTAGQLT